MIGITLCNWFITLPVIKSVALCFPGPLAAARAVRTRLRDLSLQIKKHAQQQRTGRKGTLSKPLLAQTAYAGICRQRRHGEGSMLAAGSVWPTLEVSAPAIDRTLGRHSAADVGVWA